MARDGFIFYASFYEAVKDFDSEVQNEIYTAIMEYALYGNEKELSGIPKALFTLIKPQLDANNERRENGKKGGRPAAKSDVKTNGLENKKPMVNEEKTNGGQDEKPKEKVKGNVKGKGKGKGNVKDILPPGGGADVYRDLFNHYMTLGLIKHKKFTTEMKNAIDVARRRCNYSFDDLKQLLDRHAAVVKISAGDKKYAVRARSITEFFGQKVKGGTALICSEYTDDGAKWRWYLDGGYGKSGTSEKQSKYGGRGEMEHISDINFTGEFARQLALADQRSEEMIKRLGEDGYKELIENQKRDILRQAARDDRAAYATRLLKNSGLGRRFFNRTFESFTVTPANEKAYTICRRFVRNFYKHNKGVLLAGTNGIGKTHLAAAVVNFLVAQYRVVFFGNIVDIKTRVYNSFGDNSTAAVVNKMLKCDLLCIDDLGKEKMGRDPEGEYMRELIYKLVNRLYEDERGIIITTNLNAAACEERYGAATMSRLYEMCEFIQWDDNDYRMKENNA